MGTYSKEITGKGFPDFKLMDTVYEPPKIMTLIALCDFFPEFREFLLGAGVCPNNEIQLLSKGIAIRIMRHYRSRFLEAHRAFESRIIGLAQNPEFGELVRVTTSNMRDTLFGRVHVRFLNGFSIGEQKAFAVMLFAVFSRHSGVGIWIDFDQEHDEENERCIVGVRRANGPIKSLPFKI